MGLLVLLFHYVNVEYVDGVKCEHCTLSATKEWYAQELFKQYAVFNDKNKGSKTRARASNVIQLFSKHLNSVQQQLDIIKLPQSEAKRLALANHAEMSDPLLQTRAR